MWTLTLIFILLTGDIRVNVPTAGQDQCVEMAIAFERAYREAGLDIMTQCAPTTKETK